MTADPRVVLVGGGHAHALSLRAWARDPAPGVRLVVLSPARHAPYSGMLPGYVAGHYAWADFHVDLAPLAAAAGAELVLDRAVGLDLAAGRIARAGGPALDFELCSLDTGSTSEPPPLPGHAAHLHPVKPIDRFLDAWHRFLDRVAAGEVAPRAAVLGGGVGGGELALAMAHRLEAAASEAGVTLIERGPEIAAELPVAARRRLRRALAERGVVVRTGTEATAFAADGVATTAGDTVPAGFVTAAVGARPAPWLAASGLAVTADGFVKVDAQLRSVSDARVFAVGDVAHLTANPRPKAGVFAVRQGPVLHAALRAALADATPPSYTPQRDYLRLISLGAKRALALKYGVVAGGTGPLGALLWRLKDRIDRRFMADLDLTG
jgi:selenide,water dikinase